MQGYLSILFVLVHEYEYATRLQTSSTSTNTVEDLLPSVNLTTVRLQYSTRTIAGSQPCDPVTVLTDCGGNRMQSPSVQYCKQRPARFSAVLLLVLMHYSTVCTAQVLPFLLTLRKALAATTVLYSSNLRLSPNACWRREQPNERIKRHETRQHTSI